jgi:hypothetical protein
MLLRFEIDGSDWSNPAFLSSGETAANLNECGKTPSVKDRFASRQSKAPKTSGHDFKSDVGI